MKTPEQITQNPEFRELKPIDHWSTSMPLDAIPDGDFDNKMRETVTETGQNFLGFKITEKTLYIRTRYPRKKYGVPSIEECRASTDVLAKKLGIETSEQQKVEEPRFRIVLGLLEGYGKDNKIHTIEEVKSELGGEFDLCEGEIYSAGFLYNDEYTVYREPVVIIEGDKSKINKVYALAEKFCQERFTVDDLEDSKSYTVETKYCKNPDPE
ncbi:MAG: hypothetical protein WCV69_00215 [Patescibacteria group bacterium]|jgi:hypothetical protein